MEPKDNIPEVTSAMVESALQALWRWDVVLSSEIGRGIMEDILKAALAVKGSPTDLTHPPVQTEG